jgi:hypothetical protein
MTEETLPQKLRIKADMITLCERIQWGSETSLMREAADRIEELEASLNVARMQREGLAQANNSLSEQNATLLKRMDAAMNYIKAIEGDAYKLSAVYLILNGGKDGD